MRGKVISGPVPVFSATNCGGQGPEKGQEERETKKPTSLAALVQGPVPDSTTPNPHQQHQQQQQQQQHQHLLAPKPKKSLSHVSLGLKPLPNVSLAPTVAPSANTSAASPLLLGGLTLTRPSRGDVEHVPVPVPVPTRAQTVPPATIAEQRPVEPRRAQTENQVPTIVRHNNANAVSRKPPKSGLATAPVQQQQQRESSAEDLAPYSIPANFARALSTEAVVPPLFPAPLIDVPPPPRVASPVPHATGRGVPVHGQAQPQPQRRGSALAVPRATSPPLPRPESPTPRATSSMANATVAQAPKNVIASVVPACYRKPEPLPLSPPPRAKSPYERGVDSQTSAEEDNVPTAPTAVSQLVRARSPALPPLLPPVPVSAPMAVPTGRTKPMAKRDEDASERSRSSGRSSQRSQRSQRSREADETGYLPVAQLPARPVPSRQSTAQSRASALSTTRPPLETKRGLSSASTKAQLGRVVDESSEVDVELLRELEAAEVVRGQVRSRTRSPEAALAGKTVLVRARLPPSKDLDSPLPPPPAEFVSPQHAPTLRSPPTSPDPERERFVVASPLSSSSHGTHSQAHSHSRSRQQQQRTASPVIPDMPSPPLTAQYSQPDAFMHGRSCSPASSAALGGGRVMHYPPSDFDERGVPSRDQLTRAAGLVVIAQNGVRVPFGDLFSSRRTVVIFIRHFWCVSRTQLGQKSAGC